MFERAWKAILNRSRFSPLALSALALWPASFVYRFLFRMRRRFAGKPVKVSVPVVAIGNITVGGSGKTPMVELIARHLLDHGIRVGVVSSGYGRRSRLGFVEEGYKTQLRDVAETGDEVKLLAVSLPEAMFSIDRSKAVAASRLAQTGLVDVIIVDDGFQHFLLERDLDIVAFDAAARPRHLRIFPLGTLREPVESLARADVIIMTRGNLARDRSMARRFMKGISRDIPLYHATFVITELATETERLPVKYLEDKSVMLFAGVGNFEALRKQVDSLAGDLEFALELSDHQRYDDRLLRRIKQLATKHEPDVLVTTGKDWVKVQGFDFGRECYYLELSIDLDPGEERLVSFIMERLRLKPQEK